MEKVDSKSTLSNNKWFTVAALFTIWAVVFGLQYSFGIFFRSLQDSLGCSRGAISWAMTIHLFVFALTMVPTGLAIERFSIRVVYTLATFGFSLPLALCGRVSEPYQLYLLYALMGVSTGIFGPSVFTVITRLFVEKRGLALGVASAGAGFGALIMAPLTEVSIASFGWRNTFTILGLSSLMILLTCAQQIRRTPGPVSKGVVAAPDSAIDSDQAQRQSPAPGMTFRQAIRTRQILFIILASASAQLTSRVIVVHIAPHATDMGISSFVAAMAISTIGCGSLLGRIIMGFFQDRIGPRRSMIICLSTMGVCMFALPFMTSDVAFFVFAILFGFAFGGDVPQVPAITAQCFGVASLSIIYAVVAGTFTVLASLGPLAAGYIFDMTLSYTFAFLGTGVFLFLGVFSISQVK